jgi:hypothetical protein
MIGIAWRAHRVNSERKEILEAATQENRRLQRETRAIEERTDAVMHDCAQLKTALEALRVAEVKAVAQLSTATIPSPEQLVARNPQLKRQEAEYLRANFVLRDGPLLQKLKFSPEQIRMYYELSLECFSPEVVRQLQSESDNRGATKSPRGEAQAKAELKELLGSEGTQQLREFNRSATIRNQLIGALGGELAATGAPLSADQGDKLTQIFANASSAYQRGRFATLDTIDWDAALAQAPSVLSRVQLDALNAAIVRRRLVNKLSDAVRADKSLP